MSFDPVSYAMGRQAGGGSYQEGYDDGYSVGYAQGEDAGRADVLSGANVGKVVVYDDVGYQLAEQTEITVDENGIVNTTLVKEVNIDVPLGYTKFRIIEGTLANPLGNSGLTIQGLINSLTKLQSSIGAMARIEYDASVIGAGTGVGFLSPSELFINAIGAHVTSNASSAFTMTWGTTGLSSAYMEQNGTITDISQYASLITTTIAIPD